MQIHRRTWFDVFRLSLMLSPVNWLRPTIALLLVAFWMPLTTHCDLERLTGFEFLACADQGESQPHSDNDCTTDACLAVESGCYKVEDKSVTLPAPVLLPVLVTPLTAEAINISPRSFDLTDSAPPELSHIWQFSFRTALPPRAPSVVS